MHENDKPFVAGVLPARYASTRMPYKLTRMICGKSILQWTWEAARAAHLLDELIIACDHDEIVRLAESFGAKTVLTSSDHTSGSDRIAEAVRDLECDIIINIQSDEPLVHSSVVDRLAQEMMSDRELVMATVKKEIHDESDIANRNVVKVVCDRFDYALYFSRSPLPYYRDTAAKRRAYKHLGIYAYTKDFLFTFKNLPQSWLESAESLEQLRVLEAGYKIKVVETAFDSVGVDTEEDLVLAERLIRERQSQ